MVASLVVVTFPLEPMPTHGCVARVVEMWMWLGLLRANPIPDASSCDDNTTTQHQRQSCWADMAAETLFAGGNLD